MSEIDFRLECLKQNIGKFDRKRIALYGTADNAKAILREFSEQNIVALLDQRHTGEYIFGKKVISLEEAVQIKIEIIIIAAEAVSAQIVSKRIFSYCQMHGIGLLNMYGMEEEEIRRQILLQEISYMDFSKEDMLRQMMQNEAVCFQLMGVLCVSKYFEKEDFLTALEKQCGIHQMAKKRMQAEEMADTKSPYGISDIYKNFQSITFATEEEIQNFQFQEERLHLDSIVPRIRMAELLNYAYRQEKKIFIVSDLRYSEGWLRELLDKIGVQKYHGIIQENLLGMTKSNGALRKGLKESFRQRVLYIGTNQNPALMLAQVYRMDVRVIKDTWELLEQVSEFHIKKTDIPNEKRNVISEWVQDAMNSPFIEDNKGNMEQIPDQIEEIVRQLNLREKTAEHLQLFPFPAYSRKQELEKLEFPTYRKPLVSVVIPVYNRFGYTYNCLRSILYNSGNMAYEVIIADDGSIDDTVHLDRWVKGIKILHCKENLLFLRNCNQAAQHAKGKYIIFLNNDTQVRRGWMKPLAEMLESRPDVGMAGSKLIYPDGTLQEAGGIIWEDGTGANYGRGDNPNAPEYNYVKEVDYISGASIIVRKELWEKIGGFDERYAPAYCEDSDLAFEIRRLGMKVMYQPASEVVHFEGISNGIHLTGGIKCCQTANIEKLRQKWEEILVKEHYQKEKKIFEARERKHARKTILLLSETTPKDDRDIESKTIYSHIKLFLEKGYIVKLVPLDYKNADAYAYDLQQMGIEVLYGEYYKQHLDIWLLENQKAIEYALLTFPCRDEKIINILKRTSIKVHYYGEI